MRDGPQNSSLSPQLRDTQREVLTRYVRGWGCMCVCVCMQGAEEDGADAIVVGSRGLGAVSRSLLRPIGLGSATDYIVHNAAVPVVVVKPTK